MPVVNALQKVTLTFTSNNLPINQVVTQPLAINIPCSDYREAVLLFRVHSFVCVGNVGTPEVQAQLFNSAPTMEDPDKVFRAGTGLGTALVVPFSATFKPTLSASPSLTGLGGAVDLLIGVKQAGTTAGSIEVAVSADIAFKM